MTSAYQPIGDRFCFECAERTMHGNLRFHTHRETGFNVVCLDCLTSELEGVRSWDELRAETRAARAMDPDLPLQLVETLPLNLADLPDRPTGRRIGSAGLDCRACRAVTVHSVWSHATRFDWSVQFVCTECRLPRDVAAGSIADQEVGIETPAAYRAPALV